MCFVLFGCIRDHLVALRNSVQLGRTSAKVRATKSHRNFLHERTQSTPLDPKLTFLCVSYYFCAFGTFGCLTKLVQNGQLVQKFVPRSYIGILLNERTQPTPLDSKLMFWCVSYYLGAFGTVWLPYGTRSKTGRNSAKVLATNSRQNFSLRTHPIHPIGP